MKKQSLLSGSILALLMTLGIAGSAHASDYTGDCANVPFSVSGNVNISDSSCSIGHSVTATGSIFITATSIAASDLTASGGDVNLSASGSITTGSITSSAVAFVQSSGSTVTTGDVIGPSGISVNSHDKLQTDDLTSSSGAIFAISSDDEVDSGTISGHNTVTVTSKQDLTTDDVKSSDGSIYINTDEGDVSVAKVEGKDGTIEVLAYQGKIEVSDKVTGDHTTQIFAAQNTISLQDVVNSNGDVRIFANMGGGGSAFEIGSGGSNGVTSIHNPEGQWNIYVSNGGGDINYSGSDLLQVNNSSGPAGAIVLDGKDSGTVTLAGDLNADGSGGQNAGVIEIYGINVVTNDVTISASAPGQTLGYINFITNAITDDGGLTITMEGNGLNPSFYDLSLFPVGSHSVDAPTDPSAPITNGPYSAAGAPLAITGSGDLTITQTGNDNGMKIYGAPFTLNVSHATITQTGSNNSAVVGSTDGDSYFTNATLGGEIKIHNNTTSSGQTPGTLSFVGTSIDSPLSGNVLLDVSGTGSGDGGTLNLPISDGSISFGTTGNTVTLKADGGSTGGDAGTVNAGFGGTLTATIEDGNAITASAKGGDGKGGTITIASDSFTVGSGATSSITADAHGTGNGGTIQLTANSGDLALGASSDNIRFSAIAGTTGDGGTITLTVYNSTLTMENSAAANTFDVTAGTNGKGGTIEIHALEIDNTSGGVATLLAQGKGTGGGGKIIIDLFNDFTAVGGSSDLALDAKATGTGNGGEIDVTACPSGPPRGSTRGCKADLINE